MNGRTWTISNVLSVSRIVLVVPIVLLLLGEGERDRAWAVALMVVAAMTDTFDGMLARALGQVSDVGKILDPLADKVAVVSIVAVLTFKEIIPFWFLALAAVRDLAILVGGMYVRRRKHIVLQSNALGKLTVTVMTVYVMIAAIRSPSTSEAEWVFQMFSALMMVASFVSYVMRFSGFMRRES